MKDGQKFPHFDKYPNFTIITNFLFEVFIKIMVVCRQMKKNPACVSVYVVVDDINHQAIVSYSLEKAKHKQ